MQDLNPLKQQVRDAFANLEAASTAIETADTTDETVETDKLEAAFVEAERSHKDATARLERATNIETARRSLPVATVEDAVEETPAPVTVGREEPVYRSDFQSASFFRDVLDATKGDSRAAERLAKNNKQVGEARALNSTDTSGGEFIPPEWMLSEFVAVAKAGRPFANLVNRRPLPPGTDSINLPKLSSGSSVAAQQDNGSVSSTDSVTTSVTIPVITVAGQQDLSRQAFERSAAAGAGLEGILAQDLLTEYAKQIDVQCLSGSGSSGQAQGLIGTSSIVSVTYTDSSPTVAELYPKIADAVQQIHTNRYLAPSVIVMAPRRWAWFLTALDSQNRPLVVPAAQAVNAEGILSNVAAENVVGQLHGLPVVVDSNIPTNTGAGTNQDTIIVTRAEDLYLFEDTPKVRVFEEVLSGSGGIRIQLFNYAAFSAARYAKASAIVTGTGLVTPTF